MSRCCQCEVLAINGVATHEQGCPNSWKHPVTGVPYSVACWQCGFNFVPEERHENMCPDCREENSYGLA